MAIMATFTIRLGTLIEENFDFGLADYPIFDESYRAILNDKILAHYYNYEIGQETPEMFRFVLNRRLNEIMPYWNQFYRSQLLEINPLETVNMVMKTTTANERGQSGTVNGTTNIDTTDSTVVHATDDVTKNESATSESTSSNESAARSVASEYPQVSLQPNRDYARSATDANNSSSQSANSATTAESTTGAVTDSTTTVTGNSDRTDAQQSQFSATLDGVVDHVSSGYQGHSAELLMTWRKAFLNIDMDVISALEDCFMSLWDNNDAFGQTEFPGGGVRYGWLFGFWRYSF